MEKITTALLTGILFIISVLMIITITPTTKVYAGLKLEYTVTIGKKCDTANIQLDVSNIDTSYLHLEFRPEARDQKIESYLSNLNAESNGLPLTITDIGDGKWRINSPNSTATIRYDIKKIVPYSWSHLYADNTEVAVYIDDEYGFLMAPFFFAYPLDSENMSPEDVSSINIQFKIPNNWEILTPYAENDNHFTVEQIGNNLLDSFINRQQIYMGKMKFYASKWVENCKVQMGVPYGDDNFWELQTQQDVQNYVDATATVLTEYTKIFGKNPYSVYTMYPNFRENKGEKCYSFPGTRYFGNGYQYWPEDRRQDLLAHMSLSFICSWGDAPLKTNYDIEKGVGEMYYGHTLSWNLFHNETDLGNMYYWYLVYDRIHGTPLTAHYEYTSYVRGEWLAMLLDKEMQKLTDNSMDLSIVMSGLYQRYIQTGYSVTYQDLKKEIELITNSDFSTFFSSYIDNDVKIPAYQYIEAYKEYFLNLPSILKDTYHLKLYGKTFPLFVLIEMTTNLQEHIWAGMFYQNHLDKFASYLLTLHNIEMIDEIDVENALSDLTNKDCTGFFNRWENSFGKLSLTELREWLHSYNNDETNSIKPVTKIKANGESGTISISAGSPVSITIELYAGDEINKNADWWVLADTPFGLYSYVYPTGWIVDTHLTIQTNIFNLIPFEVLNLVLPIGDYTFYFAVDNNADGIMDLTWCNSVCVNVQ